MEQRKDLQGAFDQMREVIICDIRKFYLSEETQITATN